LQFYLFLFFILKMENLKKKYQFPQRAISNLKQTKNIKKIVNGTNSNFA
jgi:hypothetical protein